MRRAMEQIGAVLTALSALLIALGGVITQRNKSVRIADRQVMADNRRLAKQFQASLRHVRRLETLMANHGLDFPDRPPEMDPGWGLELDEPRKEVAAS